VIEEFYKEKLSWNERISSILGKNHSHIDNLILERNPQLSFTEDGKIDLDKIYMSNEEVRKDSSPYDEYYKCLKNIFLLDEIDSFCDVGCATGHFLKKITKRYLILTWSSVYPENLDAPPQHVSCLYFEDVKKLMECWGFEFDQEKTDRFLEESQKYKNFYGHWRESFSIWKVK